MKERRGRDEIDKIVDNLLKKNYFIIMFPLMLIVTWHCLSSIYFMIYVTNCDFHASY